MTREETQGRVPRLGVPAVTFLATVLRSWASQDVARANAGLAAIRLQNRRRQYDEVETYLRQLAHDRVRPTEEDSDHRAAG